jgi:NTE family protein
MAAITRLLAQAARDEYRDRITLLTLDPEPKGGVHARPKLTEGAHGVRLATLGIPTDPAGARAAFSSVLQLAIDTDYLLVDPSRLHPDILAALAADFPRLVYLTGDGFEAPPLELPAGRVSWAVQLGEHRPLTHPAFRPGTTRVRFDDVAGLARITDVDQLSKADRARLLRWWRALSERRVGLALGGGGAWGYAHTTLIRRMVQAGIPIDAVAGSSFGSLCGAFYCVLQDDDWCKDLEVYGPKAERDTRLAFFTSAVLERGVDGALLGALAARGRPSKHAPRLEDLEVPLLPVATNIGSGSEAVVSLGTVGWGVRCSSSFPGIFAPTTGKGFRYVDGGIIRNVPTDPLVGEGLDLVIASNIVPNPQYAASSSPRFKGRVGRLLHELNPIGRLDDLVRSSLILMHAAGDAVAWEADVVFNSEPVRESPGGFSAGASIAEQALPGVEQALPLIQAKWQAMKDRT